MDEKFKGEEALRQSGLPYTIVRPGGLKDGPSGEKKLVIKQGDKTSGSVARSDVAAVSVAALKDPAAKNVTLELTSQASLGEGETVPSLAEQLKLVFKGLKPDSAS